MSSSSEIFSRGVVRGTRGDWIGEVKASAATIVARRVNPNFISASNNDGGSVRSAVRCGRPCCGFNELNWKGCDDDIDK